MALRRLDLDDWFCVVVISALGVLAWLLGHQDPVMTDTACGLGHYLAHFGRRPIGELAVVVPVVMTLAAAVRADNRRIRMWVYGLSFLAVAALVLIPAFLPAPSGC
jgi:hypothetical protein